MSDLEQFLNFLYQKDEGYVYAPKAQRGLSWTQNWFQWPQQKQQLTDFLRTETIEYDVYVAPALFKSKSAEKDNIKSSNVVWVEYDGQDINYKKLSDPDLIVASGTENHFHCYWKIDKTTNFEVIEDINRRLTYHLGADTSGWDASQVLRPPGTVNHKHGNSTSLIKCEEPFSEHAFSEFDDAPPLKDKPLLFTPQDLLDPAQVLKKLPQALRLEVIKSNAPVGSRSTFLMAMGYKLARANLTPLEGVTLLWFIDNRVKKFTGRSDVLQRLGEIVGIAFGKYERETTIQGYSPLEVIHHVDELDWVIPGWLHKNGIMLLSGQPGVGKTQLSLDVGMRLASGQQVLGLDTKRNLRVAVLSLEMALEELNYIYKRQGTGLGQVENGPTYLNAWNSNMRIFPATDEGTFAAYEKIFEKESPDVVIIDSLSELATDDLKETEARKLMKWLRLMRGKYNHAQIIIHHNRKAQSDNKRPNKLSDLYGSYVFAKLSETVLCLWKDEKSADESHLELLTLKARFGKKETFYLTRTEHLLFEQREPDTKDKNDALDRFNFTLDTTGLADARQNPDSN